MQIAATNTEQDIATRQVILQAAYEEIHVRGFQAASLSKILANTNVTKGALYHYFPTKLALGYAVVDEILAEHIQQHWVQPLLETDDPISSFNKIIVQSGVEITEEDIQCGCPLNNLAQEMAPIDEGFRSTMIVASLEGCMGLAKNAQSKNVLSQCGQSVIDYLESLRA